MAYATVEYGEDTPQSIDRFGTEQTSNATARNGRKFDSYLIRAERYDRPFARLGLRVLGWVHMTTACAPSSIKLCAASLFENCSTGVEVAQNLANQGREPGAWRNPCNALPRASDRTR